MDFSQHLESLTWSKKVKNFKVRITKPIEVRDVNKKVIQRLEIGDIREVTFDAGFYWVSSPPIYKDEGELVVEEHLSDHEFYD